MSTTLEKENATPSIDTTDGTSKTTNGTTNEPVAKKQKTQDGGKQASAKETFRSWANDKESSGGPIYTLKCTYGVPGQPLPSYLKTSKKDMLTNILKGRGIVNTNGCSKSDLLRRVQNDLPYVTIELDGRECIQRVINSFLHYFGYDSSHLFKVKMPARGTLKAGTQTLMDAMEIDPHIADMYKNYFRDYGNNLWDWPVMEKRLYTRITKRMLRDGKYTIHDLRRACENQDDAMSSERKLSGSAFNPMEAVYDWDMMEKTTPQGHYSLQDLELIAGDVLCFEYDFGSPSMFHVKIEKVTGGKDGNETDLLPEVNIAGHSTHVKLVKKEYKAPKQY